MAAAEEMVASRWVEEAWAVEATVEEAVEGADWGEGAAAAVGMAEVALVEVQVEASTGARKGVEGWEEVEETVAAEGMAAAALGVAALVVVDLVAGVPAGVARGGEARGMAARAEVGLEGEATAGGSKVECMAGRVVAGRTAQSHRRRAGCDLCNHPHP